MEFVFQQKNVSEKMNGDFSILNGENSLQSFFFFKVQNTSEKHLNGEISIQNGDFSILNGENSLQSFFQNKVQNASEKK